MRAIEQKGIQRGALNPNKGVDTRKYLYAVGAAFVVIMIAILLFAWHHAASDHPAGAPPHATDRAMVVPGIRSTFC